MMKMYIAKDQDDWARAAADVVMETVSSSPHPVLVLPTGSTPLPLYEELIRRRRRGISFAHVTTFNLDEYIGLPKGHPQTYRVFMEQNLFSRLDIPEGQWHIPDGSAADPERAAAEYDAVIAAAGGVDLAVLGVGHNGHIGFNEPGTPASSPTHVAVLSKETRLANARFFSGLADVPTKAITMGLGPILASRRILFLAEGADKAEIVRKVFRGPITINVPGSLLQQHADVTVILDEDAAARIEEPLIETGIYVRYCEIDYLGHPQKYAANT